MADDMCLLRRARPTLVIGAVAHVTGLLVYDSFPYLYLISILILCWSYYLFLKGDGYRPLAMAVFWGMAILLAIPIVGLLAGIQKILFSPKKGEKQSKQSRLMGSLVSLLVFIPFIAVIAAMSIPAFPDAPAWLMTGILVCAAVAEAIVIAALFHEGRKKVRDGNVKVDDT